jgi:hypothetical protein
MKKTIIAVLISASLFSFQPVNAQGITLSQLVELFISIGVITPDKADAARLVVANNTPVDPVQEFIKNYQAAMLQAQQAQLQKLDEIKQEIVTSRQGNPVTTPQPIVGGVSVASAPAPKPDPKLSVLISNTVTNTNTTGNATTTTQMVIRLDDNQYPSVIVHMTSDDLNIQSSDIVIINNSSAIYDIVSVTSKDTETIHTYTFSLPDFPNAQYSHVTVNVGDKYGISQEIGSYK